MAPSPKTAALSASRPTTAALSDSQSTPRPGRPPGATSKSSETRERLYRTALAIMAERGFETTTLRDLATAAGSSLGLLYRYFPTKHAIVLSLYDELTARFAEQAGQMPQGSLLSRFVFTVRLSIATIAPHRRLMTSILPALLGSGEDGLFAPATAFSRERVQGAFVRVATEATDVHLHAGAGDQGQALGKLLYLSHLAILLFWLLDRSEQQAATAALLQRTQELGPLSFMLLSLPQVPESLRWMDGLLDSAFFAPASIKKGE